MNAHTLFDYFLCVAMVAFVIGATMGAVCGTNDTQAFHADADVTGAHASMAYTAHHPDGAWAQRKGIIMLGYVGIWVI